MKNPNNRAEVQEDGQGYKLVTVSKSGRWLTLLFSPTEAVELGKALATVQQPGDVYEIPYSREDHE